jgi:uncharacterized membrane protein YtjA (UPF0391 family)
MRGLDHRLGLGGRQLLARGGIGLGVILARRRTPMLNYAIIFLIIALVAGVLGFGGIAGSAVGIAKILFLVFIVLFLVSLIMGRRGRI